MTRKSLRKHYARIMKAFEFTPDREIYQSSKMIIDLLNQTEWIPVNERLPEENGGYLVTVKRGYVTTALWVGNTENWKEVTAWMPLPEPYKEDKE